MPRIDLVKKIQISGSGRARQLEDMFDVPRKKESVVEWHGEICCRHESRRNENEETVAIGRPYFTVKIRKY